MSDKDLFLCQYSDFSIAQEFVVVLRYQFPYFQVPGYTKFIQELIYICRITEK